MRLHRDEETESVDAGTVLQPGDRILVKGRFEELQAFAALVGPEVYDEDLRRQRGTPRAVRVREREVIGRSLAELDLARAHRCLVTQVDRGDVALEPSAELRLERDDLVHVVGRRDDLRAVAARLGRFRRSTSETDIAVYAGGILLGLLIGRAHLDLHGTHFTLGTAGGLLLTGVLLGRFRDLGPLHANVPRAARQLVRDLGILLFVTEAGVRAGESLAGGAFGAAMGDTVLRALGGAVAVTAAAVILPVLLGRWLLKLRPADAWGSLGGGMTSSAALSAIRRAADSNAPALSYAAAYAVASVLATIAGQVVVLWMH
jgi:putative transport protein